MDAFKKFIEQLRIGVWLLLVTMAAMLIIADKIPSLQGPEWTSENLKHAAIFALLAIALKPPK